MKKDIVKKFIVILSLALIQPTLSFAAKTDETPLKSAVTSLNETVENLIDTKDVTSTPKDKSEIERKSRLATFNEVLNLSFTEINDLKKQLNDLPKESLSADELQIKDQFLDNLNIYEAYYKEVASTTKDDISIIDLKSAAKDLKEWRGTYEASLEKMFDFLFIFQSESILNTAKTRSEKISGDLSKIKKSGLPIANLQNLLSKAAGNITQAESLTLKAHTDFVSVWRENQNASGSTLISPNPTSTPQDIASSTKTNEKKEAQAPANINSIRINLQKSLLNIKSAYQNFFEMYNIAKILIK